MKYIELIEQLFAQYGYWVLLLGLPLDAIALPIPPGNTTLTYTGYLSYKGILNGLFAFEAAFAGAVIGMTVTYWIGLRLGAPIIKRYGKWLLLKPELLERTRVYYKKYGNKLLFISCFVPGIRQFIGYCVGILRIPYRVFALYGYTGAFLWVLAFFSLGYAFGEQWQAMFILIEKYLRYVCIVLGTFLFSWILFKSYLRLKRTSKLENDMD